MKSGFPIRDALNKRISSVPWAFIERFDHALKLRHNGLSARELADRGGLTYYQIYVAVLNRWHHSATIRHLGLPRNKYRVADRLQTAIRAWRDQLKK